MAESNKLEDKVDDIDIELENADSAAAPDDIIIDTGDVLKEITESEVSKSETNGKSEDMTLVKRKRKMSKPETMDTDNLPKKPNFPPAVETGESSREFRKITVPPHRYTPLKENWMKIFTPSWNICICKFDSISVENRLNFEAVKTLKTLALYKKQKISSKHLCLDSKWTMHLLFSV